MRIAIGGIEHETNTYAKGLTTAGQFAVLRADRILATAGQETSIGGAVAACLQQGITPVPLLHAWAQPSGMIEAATYLAFKTELLDLLRTALPVDGCVLCLHGAGVVEGIPDLEGDLCAAVRALVGDDVPITAVFDLHGNITEAMGESLNGVFACHQYPHIDLHQRAAEAVALVVEQVQTRRKAHCSVVSLPLLLPTTTTFEGIGQTMLNEVLQQETQEGVVDISWFHGFPYTDVPHVGASIVVTTWDERGPDIAGRLAADLWSRREDFRARSLSADAAVDEALRLAAAQNAGPIVINETSDNCGGGAPGDGTHLLRALLDRKPGAKACFGFVVDAETAALAHRAGVGKTIDILLGGRTDTLHGAPIAAQAYVKSLHDGRIEMQAMMKGAPVNLGPMARLVIDNMDVIVASRRSQTFDPEPFLALGMDVRRYAIVALKSSNHFRAGFKGIAAAIVTADPPGLCTHHIEIFPRQSTARRLWPLDSRATYPEETTT